MNIRHISEKAPKIKCIDPLSEFLGSFEGGVIEYDFEYIAKLTGHACPTVLTAYLSSLAVAKALYGASEPVRGEIQVSLRDNKEVGTTGVFALVFGAIFGAGDEGGFGGIGGLFDRSNRLEFGAKITEFASFCRNDTKECVTLDFNFAPIQKIATPDIGVALQGFKKQGDISAFQAGWIAKLEFIVKNFENMGIAIVKNSNKI